MLETPRDVVVGHGLPPSALHLSMLTRQGLLSNIGPFLTKYWDARSSEEAQRSKDWTTGDGITE
jgi:hypothetical protein